MLRYVCMKDGGQHQKKPDPGSLHSPKCTLQTRKKRGKLLVQLCKSVSEIRDQIGIFLTTHRPDRRISQSCPRQLANVCEFAEGVASSVFKSNKLKAGGFIPLGRGLAADLAASCRKN